MGLGTPERSGNFRGNYTGRPSRRCESHWKKMIGKPYSGKPNVRFDEGELEIGLSATTPALYSTVSNQQLSWQCLVTQIFSYDLMLLFSFAPAPAWFMFPLSHIMPFFSPVSSSPSFSPRRRVSSWPTIADGSF